VVEQEQRLIELALAHRLLTRRQADMVREELEMMPGERAGNVMLRRHYLTDEQLDDLREMLLNEKAAQEAQEPAGPSLFEQETPQQKAAFRGIARGGALPEGEEPVETGGAPAGEQLNIAQVRAQQAAQAAQSAQSPRGARDQALHAEAQAPISGHPRTLVGFLRLARHWGCSDLHLSVGRPPFVRLNGHLRYMEMDPLTPELAEQLNFSGLNDEQRQLASEHLQIDFSLEVPGVGRHRCSVFRQRLGWDGTYRIVRASTPTLEELGLPTNLRRFTEYQQGLVMVTGPAGSGKTTTCAALLDLVNTSRKDHIITVEEPVEYIVEPKNCQVTQREVGRHTESFATALRAALREDPDIILIGELRDLETTSISISAAETGHLVFGTLHTGSAIRTVARIVDVYPVSQQQQVCVMVAESLRGVITQQLLPRKDGQGQVLALEVLVNTSGVATQIKEGKTHLIQSLMQAGKKQGMMLMEESLMMLLKGGYVTGREAYRRANNKQPFEAFKEEG
jgi:twitching motility protein PilT